VPKVAVLMCTMQGQHFLAEQLNSIATQTHPRWAIWASDDGSDDHTHAILEYYQSHWGEDRISIHAGPAEGSTANFLSLTCRADIDADYFAYADQDDVWESDKLERAVNWLKTVPEACRRCTARARCWSTHATSTSAIRPCSSARPTSAMPWCRASPAATPWSSTAPPATCCARPVRTSRPSRTTGGPTCW
jgi:glycosyltransferase involved in cell wall biosynthesis